MKVGRNLIAKAKIIKIQKAKKAKAIKGKKINISKITGPIIKKAISNSSSTVSKATKKGSAASKTAISIIKKLSKNKSISGL